MMNIDPRYQDLIKQVLGGAMGAERSLTQPIATPAMPGVGGLRSTAQPLAGASGDFAGGGVRAVQPGFQGQQGQANVNYEAQLKAALSQVLAKMLASKGGTNYGMR